MINVKIVHFVGSYYTKIYDWSNNVPKVQIKWVFQSFLPNAFKMNACDMCMILTDVLLDFCQFHNSGGISIELDFNLAFLHIVNTYKLLISWMWKCDVNFLDEV
jgi:hypothetical protein